MKRAGPGITEKNPHIFLSFKNQDDLYSSLRYVLIFGRIIGLIPWQGMFQPFSENLKFTWRSQAAIYSVTMSCLLFFSAVINGFVSFRNTNVSPSDLAWSANLAVFYGIGGYMYLFMVNQAHKFLRVFQKWRETFIFYDGVDQKLFRDVNIIALCIFTSCILEHSYAHLKFFPIVGNSERRLIARKDLQVKLANASAWETYYWRSHPFVGDIIPYHFISAFGVFILAKYSILAWNFGDILVTVMSRALYYRFKMLHQQAQQILVGQDGLLCRDTAKWRQLAVDHEKLCDLAQTCEELLSPLVFALFGVNVYYFCIQLNLGLTPTANTTLIASIYAVWSFLHLIMRLLVVSITASHIHTHAHKIVDVLKKCPIECYTAEIERAERLIRTSQIGLTGLGCFTITRQFILQIVNVVFTFEIVLLQTSNTNSSS
ncbi:unnamed protein product [Allacma fusca]|uniref:Gustatory receptor n=1 Tax=Allacma fusca TaxID=39272 RepID=A0A8J2JEJ7_9HEXA|nr:unnamed protein product [Allacma fusca]